MDKLSERLRKVGSWLRSHRREVIGVICVLAIVVAVTPVLADGTPPAGNPDGKISVTSQIALWIATLFAWIAQHVVKMIVILIDLVVVPIMRYNNFVSSPVVSQGWAVVRDLVNMFFVVILLLIAFQTIFGVGRADWKRQVPRLLIMAVVINFSRTIAGIMIDFGQVVMFTFVNAIADVAGGNFIQLFGLDKLFNYSSDAVNRASQNGVGFEAFDFFGAAFLTMVLTFVILATMIILAALLAFRIVVLWCLIIVAPLTFFLGGAKGVIGGAEGYYADWWKRFTSAVSLGPILSFFVWLSLAAASSGNLAEKQGFDVQTDNEEAASIGGELTQAFDAPHMTSLIIAVALLFAGFEVSQQTAGSIGGRAGAMAAQGVKGIPGLARSLAKVGVPAMALPAVAANTGGLALAGMVGGGFAASAVGARAKGVYLDAKHAVGAGLRGVGSTVAQADIGKVGFGIGALYRGTVGRVGVATAGAGTGLIQGVEHTQEHDLAAAVKETAGMDTDSRLAMLNNLKGSGRYKDKLKRRAIVIHSLQSKENRNKLEEAGQLDSVAQTWYEEVADFADDATKDKIGKVLMKRPSIAAGKAYADHAADRRPGETDQAFRARFEADAQKEVNKQMASFKKSDLASIEPADFKNRLVRQGLRDTRINGVSLEEMMLRGEAGGAVNQAALRGEIEADHDQARNRIAMRMNNLPVGGAEAVQALVEAIRSLTPSQISNGVVTERQMRNPAFFNQFMENAPDDAMAAVRSQPVLMNAFADMAEAVERPIVAAPPADAAEQLGRQNAQRVRTGLPPGGFDQSGQSTAQSPAEAALRVDAIREMIEVNPQVVVNLGDALTSSNFTNPLAAAVARAVQPTHVDQLQQAFMNAPDANGQQRVINALNLIERAIRAQAGAGAGADARLTRIMRFQNRFGR